MQRNNDNSNNGDPHKPTSSQLSNFPFVSRKLSQPAPLFYDSTDEFREEDDEMEHEREIADFYALQRSRRHFGSSHLNDSSDLDSGERSSADSGDEGRGTTRDKGKGIRSSWRGGEDSENIGFDRDASKNEGVGSRRGGSLHGDVRAGNLVEVGLDDTSARTDVDADDAVQSPSPADDPPLFQPFGDAGGQHIGTGPMNPFLQKTSADRYTRQLNGLMSPSSTRSYVTLPRVEQPLYDAFWAHLFLLSVASLLATEFLVYLHTNPPDENSKWGDTVYVAIRRSYFLLGVYTLVSVFVSLLWLALLRFYVRFLVYTVIVSVPVILYSFSLYPFVSSFQGAWHGSSLQDKIMRLGSAIPFIIACLWIYTVVRTRYAIGKAVNILEFACRILAANPELLILGLGTLVCIVCWTWLWLVMFARVFLGGHLSGSKSFIINVSSWWLGAYFILTYLWSLGVIGGVQRAVTAATVSQWYFHRLAIPAPTSSQILQAAIAHALTTLFGTVCFSKLLGQLIRLPLILLPGRLASLLSLFVYSFVPTPVTALTNPLALSYAAIHSRPLAASARGLSQLTVLSPLVAPTLSPHPFSRPLGGSHGRLSSYRLSKLILHATRFIVSLALGFGGWVITARNLTMPGVGGDTRGSLYAYVVGLVAGAIGWSVLGSVEGIVADIVDASLICWGSEVGTYGREARYCREAGFLFDDELGSTGTSQWHGSGV